MSKQGYIYVAIDKGSPGLCKIGQTTNVAERERTLNGGSPKATIKIVESVYVDDMDAVERAFHEILHYKRQDGEWFNVEEERVLPMLKCFEKLDSKARPIEDASGSKVVGRGGWHEDGWRMHCEGATQAEIAKKFGVTEGAVSAMKKKMRGAGRGSEEARPSAPRRGRVAGGRGSWHEDGWQMHRKGATQAEIAKRFGVTQGAVSAMKKKMQRVGRESEEARRSAPRRGHKVKQGAGATPQSAFRQPIIDVLKELGGGGQAKDVLERVEGRMRKQLNQADYKLLKSGREEVWKNNAQWMRQKLKDDGTLKSDSPRGWWELA